MNAKLWAVSVAFAFIVCSACHRQVKEQVLLSVGAIDLLPSPDKPMAVEDSKFIGEWKPDEKEKIRSWLGRIPARIEVIRIVMLRKENKQSADIYITESNPRILMVDKTLDGKWVSAGSDVRVP